MDFAPHVPAEAIAKFAEKATPLNQSCASLGKVALATCYQKHVAMHHYIARLVDKQMVDCVKTGGRWEANKSLEADLARNQQELDQLQKGLPQ
jgi:hypothetical protein